MILIALGANRKSRWGEPSKTIAVALDVLADDRIAVLKRSEIYRSAPLGQPGQTVYANAAAMIESHMPPAALLMRFHEIERDAGRRRGQAPLRWGARALDIDLVDWRGAIKGCAGGNPHMSGFRPLVLPHPRLHERAFVLAPLAEIAPDWRHPVLHRSAAQLLARLPGQGPGAILS